MIKFTSLIITNYKSIEYAELHYHKGVWLVNGDNTDTTFKSNGAGKSTALEAIQQCIYNKNLKGIPIEDTYNRTTKKGYRLILKFNIDNNRFKIDNNRELGTYDVYQNDICISKKGITENLKLVQSIIGFDFNAFTSLTYISHQNVITLLDSFTSSSLMKVLLDFDSIAKFENNTKDMYSTTKNNIQSLLQEKSQLQEAQNLAVNFTYTDLTPLYLLKQSINDKFLSDTISLGIPELKRTLGIIEDKIKDIKGNIENTLHKMSSTLCPTCGQDTNTSGELVKKLAEFEYNKLVDELAIEENKYNTLTNDLDSLLYKEQEIKDVFNKQIESINSNISVGEYKNKLYEETKDIVSNTLVKVQQNTTKLTEEYFNLDLLDLILKTVKSGKLHKDLLDNFAKVLNHYIDDYTKYMSISYLNIKAKASKIGMDFLLYDNRSKSFIEINTLSGGELTRVRIIVLMSMLKTISNLTKLSTNILVLDEALDTLDASAATDLSSLFQYLIDTENKFIALVSHGAQLDEIEFKGTIKAIKKDGITTIKQRNYDV